jgi:hypothetical protein
LVVYAEAFGVKDEGTSFQNAVAHHVESRKFSGKQVIEPV